ncbi:meso-butanediol dehydrogenase/(S,S)-butanediol dehydrogenase/diacetyl reductase [Duganella sp. 3397]|uniref:SDR family NAD(P)-dependent oxidoreductase n=1 Tax=Duganella sp. 3397 TaxID=2817732 RepID=UPI0028577CB5|nr:SDR family oxidoreductase [Duganella sp. 3397]MDR7049362.1 meso-butanediol dehydrogenase/(S,S)-butanediol dehydrogenase/diacetyl reductase [Duganella sp. 3397]
MNRFNKKTVLITGAASGMGLAAARRFLDEGAHVVMIDIDEAALTKAASQLPQDRVLVQVGDTADKRTADVAVKATIERFGSLDVLINNAGIGSSGDITNTSAEDFDRVMAVNVAGYFHMAKAAMPELVKVRGSIVMTSSVSGLGGDWEMFAYNTSKGAVSNMVRAMALDAAKHGVRVNAVNPSFTDTGMTRDMLQDAELVAKFKERMPLGAPAAPEGVAAVMAFLASDDARLITGVNLPVDAGLMASNGQPPQ